MRRAARLAVLAAPPAAAYLGGYVSFGDSTKTRPQAGVPPLPAAVAGGVRADGCVDARFNYQRGDVGSISASSDGSLAGAVWHPQQVIVRNGRRASVAPRLDTQGFAMVPDARETHPDYYDEAAITGGYYRACEELVRRATGAQLVAAFDHNVRCEAGKASGRRLRGGNVVQGPACFVHNDYTKASAARRLTMLAQSSQFLKPSLQARLGPRPLLSGPLVDEAAAGGRRYAFVNVWRPISPVECKPLACVDATSVTRDELVTFSIAHADGAPKEGGIYFAKHAPSHDWVYYDAMTPDEVLLIKQWDSGGGLAQGRHSDAEARRATFSLHSAFAHPATAPDARDRESIEVRLVLVY